MEKIINQLKTLGTHPINCEFDDEFYYIFSSTNDGDITISKETKEVYTERRGYIGKISI